MAKFDKSVLEKYGITGTTEVVYNPSYEVLFEEETKAGLEGFEKGQVTELGAVNVMTGIYTGRLTSIRTTTRRFPRRLGPLSTLLPRRSSPTSACSWWTVSAVPTKTAA